jgi:hypothetical protein
MNAHRCSRIVVVLAGLLLTTACGEGYEPGLEEQEAAPAELVETRSDAVISGVVRGSSVRSTTNVNLRSGPSTAYGILLTVPAGYTATILNPTPSGGFYYINYQGTRGWAHGDYWNTVAGLVVNGRTLDATQESRVRWIASNTVPRVPGTRDERLVKSARVTWWSLKEGVLNVSNPHSYSNCGGTRLAPLSGCSATTWQAGIAGAQVWNYTLSSLESTALNLYPGKTVRDVLADASVKAGYAAGTTTYNGIVNSTGDLRRSWLVRHHAVGFVHNEATVSWECISQSKSWCYSPDWYPSSAFAPNRDAAMRSIRELQAIFDGIAP